MRKISTQSLTATILSGIDFLIAPLYLLISFYQRRPLFSIPFILMCIIFALQFLSLLINIPDLNIVRIGSAMFNLLCLFSILLCLSFRKSFFDIHALAFSILKILIFLFILFIFFKYFLLVERVSVPTLASFFLPNSLPGMFDFYINKRIIVPDYFAGFTTRFTGFGPFANAASILCLVAYYLSMPLMTTNKSKILFWLVTFWMIWETHSRITTAAFFLTTFLYLLPKRRKNPAQTLGIVAIVLVLMYLLIPSGVIDSLLGVRTTSSNVRFLSYQYAVDFLLNQKPFFGFGARTESYLSDISIGSHSTIIGLLYKGGLISMLFFSIFFIYKVLWLTSLYFKYNSEVFYSFFLSIVGITIWMFLEDIDVLPFVSIAYGLCLNYLIRAEELDEIC